jgi:hypothetical protein
MGAKKRSAISIAAVSIAVLVLLVVVSVTGDMRVASGQQDATPLTKPRGHFKVERPADMFPNTAETVYQNIRAEMAAGYALARLPDLRSYLSWRRFNTAPYRSATHGARYVNNYGNRIGEAYGAFEQAGNLPEGAMLVKDSFTATADGAIYAGPMFVMKKMAAGFNSESGDWRYSMIMPDGSLFGETGGVNAESVDFCIGCHATRSKYDHLFFLPEELRLKPIEIGQ